MTGTSHRGLPMRTALVLAGGGVDVRRRRRRDLGTAGSSSDGALPRPVVVERRGRVRRAAPQPVSSNPVSSNPVSSNQPTASRTKDDQPNQGSRRASGGAGEGPRVRRGWREAAARAVACAGILFATSAGAARGGDLRGGTRTSLSDLIQAQERQVDATTRRVDRLRADVDAATRQAARADQRVAAQRRRSTQLTFGAGGGPLRGAGLRVTLTDAPRSGDRLLPEGSTADDLVVHQQDVQAVVNAMWQGGADAVQIMDQRVIATSAVRCVGNTLILQGRVYAPPYTVTAIGDPDRLSRAMDTAPGVQVFRYYVDQFGLGYDVERLGSTRVPGYAGSLDLLYAEQLP